jgi:hypothetical protein
MDVIHVIGHVIETGGFGADGFGQVERDEEESEEGEREERASHVEMPDITPQAPTAKRQEIAPFKECDTGETSPDDLRRER